MPEVGSKKEPVIIKETPVKIIISLIHVALITIVGTVTMLTNNEKLLFLLLLIMMFVKWSFYLFDRCVVTHLEKSKYYPSAAEIYGYTVAKDDMKIHTVEQFVINTALILIINKIFWVMIIRYHYSSFSKNVKKLISTYLYSNDYKNL